MNLTSNTSNHCISLKNKGPLDLTIPFTKIQYHSCCYPRSSFFDFWFSLRAINNMFIFLTNANQNNVKKFIKKKNDYITVFESKKTVTSPHPNFPLSSTITKFTFSVFFNTIKVKHFSLTAQITPHWNPRTTSVPWNLEISCLLTSALLWNVNKEKIIIIKDSGFPANHRFPIIIS